MSDIPVTTNEHITELQLQQAIRDAISGIQESISGANKALENKMLGAVDARIDAVKQHVEAVDKRTQSDVERLERRVDSKIDALDEKLDKRLDEQSQTLLEIKEMLLQEQAQYSVSWNTAFGRLETLEADAEQRKLDVALITSNQQALTMDIHGDADRPDTPSLWKMLKEMSAKTSDILTVATSNSSRIAQLEETLQAVSQNTSRIHLIEEKIQYWQRIKDTTIKAGQVASQYLFSRVGAGIAGVALSASLASLDPNITDLIRNFLTYLIGG